MPEYEQNLKAYMLQAKAKEGLCVVRMIYRSP